jgi:hypothetical protein
MYDVIAAPDATAAPAPDLGDVAAHYRGLTPTLWGTSLPGIATTFAAPSQQMALTFDACGGACDEALISPPESAMRSLHCARRGGTSFRFPAMW